MVFVGKNASRHGDIMMACGSFFLKAVILSSSVVCFMTYVPLLQDFSSTLSCGCTHPFFFVSLQSHPRLLRNMPLFHSDVTFPKFSLMFLKYTHSLEAVGSRHSCRLGKTPQSKIHKQMNFEGAEPFPYSDHGRKYLSLCCSVQLQYTELELQNVGPLWSFGFVCLLAFLCLVMQNNCPI